MTLRGCPRRMSLRDGRTPERALRYSANVCLSLVAKAIQDYLREFVQSKAPGTGPRKAKESWFDYYCRCLERTTTFRWADSPISRDQIEQINLCRNDFMHDPGIDSGQPKKSETHFDKHPLSRFDDRLERAVEIAIAQANGEVSPPSAPGSLTVSRQELFSAVADARQFCAFIETQQPRMEER